MTDACVKPGSTYSYNIFSNIIHFPLKTKSRTQLHSCMWKWKGILALILRGGHLQGFMRTVVYILFLSSFNYL